MVKFREGFVSNSSSSSFIITLTDLTPSQILCLNNLSMSGDNTFDRDPWSIFEECGCLHGSTSMDNFDMKSFLRNLDIPDNVISWGY